MPVASLSDLIDCALVHSCALRLLLVFGMAACRRQRGLCNVYADKGMHLRLS